jgi:hypothetical protein
MDRSNGKSSELTVDTERSSHESVASSSSTVRRQQSARRRWFFLGVFVVAVGLLISAFIFRQVGFAKLRRIESEITAEGGLATLGDYLDSLEVDEELQEEFWTWQENAPADTELLGRLGDNVWSWILLPPGPEFPVAVEKELDLQGDFYQQGRALVQRPGLIATRSGYERIDLVAGSSVLDAINVRSPSWLTRTELARWMAYNAARVDDATSWLEDLDRLCRLSPRHELRR